MLEAMVYKYIKLHRGLKFEVIACEAEIKTYDFLGYVDVILKGPTGWWIADMKTSQRLGTTVVQRLEKDFQLNLYAYYKDHIAFKLQLPPDEFQGVRYRLTTKNKLVRKKTESYEEYVQRMLFGTKSYDIAIPKEKLHVEAAHLRHERLYMKSLELFNGATPTQNFSYCDVYFKPCPYWSQCHGRTFSESGNELEIYEE